MLNNLATTVATLREFIKFSQRQRCNIPSKEMGTKSSFRAWIGFRQSYLALHKSTKTFRIQYRERIGRENIVNTELFANFQVSRKVSRIGIQIFVRCKLCRVDEYGHNNDRTVLSRFSYECLDNNMSNGIVVHDYKNLVTFMKKSHSGN
jgi:uncharacterized short protein YbdD (DUF466 family)